MAIFRVPFASLFLAAAFTSITSAQTTFSPQYNAFSEQPSFTETTAAPGLPGPGPS